jgi:hydrogenase maturation protease
MKTLVVGVDNTLLGDRGAGVHAMHFLRDHFELPDTEFLDGGTFSLTLADAVAEATNLIIFDAAELDAEPGCVRVLEGAAFEDFVLCGRHGLHEVGFPDLMEITRPLDSMPDNCALIGIQPESLGWGDTPGETVCAAIPQAAAMAAKLIHRWTERSIDRVVNQ